MNSELVGRSIMQDFENTTKSEVTLKNHRAKLGVFMNYWQIPGKNLDERAENWVAQAKADALRQEDRYPKWAEDTIIGFINNQKGRIERGEIGSGDTIRKYVDAVQHLCEQRGARVQLDWKYIRNHLPTVEKGVETLYRPYTLEEVRRVLAYPDRRIKPVVLLMTSCGMSIGSFERLDWGDIQPMTENGEVLAARIKLYRGKTRRHYFSYITPEGYGVIKEYMDFRAKAGEQIAADSPLIRDLFPPDIRALGGMRASFAHRPKRLKVDSVSDLVKKALRVAGMRQPKARRGHPHVRAHRNGFRYPTEQNHSFRKFFTTTASKHMQPNGTFNAEILAAHTGSLAHVYQVPTEEELLKLYLKAVPHLTISEEWRAKFTVEERVQKEQGGFKEQLNALTVRNTMLESKVTELSSIKAKLDHFEEIYTKVKEMEERERHEEWEETMTQPESDPIALAKARQSLAARPSKKRTRSKLSARAPES